MSKLDIANEDDSGTPASQLPLPVDPEPIVSIMAIGGNSEPPPTVTETSATDIETPTTVTAPPPDNVPVLWLRRGDQIVVGLLVTALLVLLGVHWVRLSRWGTAPVELSSQQPREYYYSLDINSASWVEWAQLEGIGEKLARRIVADRDERGSFCDPSDIGRVRGIGPKLLERIKPFLRGGTETTKDEPAP